jgi:hypothetical protein
VIKAIRDRMVYRVIWEPLVRQALREIEASQALKVFRGRWVPRVLRA